MAWSPKSEAQRGFYGNQATGRNIGGMFGGGVKQGLGTMQGGLGQMGQAADYYQGVLSGQQPSLGQLQQQRGLESAIQAQTAMAAQGRGGNLAAAQRQAATAGAGMAQQGVNDAAMLRISEMQGAASGLGQLGSAQAGMGLQQNLGNLGMMNDAYMNQAGLDVQYQLGQRELQEQERMGRHNRIFNWVNLGRQWAGDIANSIVGGASMSDERSKRNVQDGGRQASEMFANAPPQMFEYRPGFGPNGMRLGVMAQDLARTPMGSSMLSTGPGGMAMVDNNSLAHATAAATADQERRLRAVEGRGYAGPAEVQGQNADTPQPFRPQMMPSLGGEQWSPRNSRLGSRPTIDSQLAYEAELSRGRELPAMRGDSERAPGLSKKGPEKESGKKELTSASPPKWDIGADYQDIGGTRGKGMGGIRRKYGRIGG